MCVEREREGEEREGGREGERRRGKKRVGGREERGRHTFICTLGTLRSSVRLLQRKEGKVGRDVGR